MPRPSPPPPRWFNEGHPGCPLQAGTRPDLVVYGDSITESYLATSVGQARPDYEPNKQHWDTVIKSKHPNSQIFSISGAALTSQLCAGLAC